MFRSQARLNTDLNATHHSEGGMSSRKGSHLSMDDRPPNVIQGLIATAKFALTAVRMDTELTLDHLPPLPESLSPERSAMILDGFWAEELKKDKPSLRLAIWKLVRPQTIVTFWLGTTATLLNLSLPVITAGIVRAVDHDFSPELTFVLPPAMFLISVLATWTMQSSFFSQTCSSITSWGAITTKLLQHPSFMTTSERSRFTEGEVLNLMTVDSQTIIEVMMFMGFFCTMPLQILVSSVLLFLLLGWPFLAGFAILSFNVYMSERLGNKVKRHQTTKNTLSDDRTVLLNESFQGIRTIKLYSWEKYITDRVGAQRLKEIKELTSIGHLRGRDFAPSPHLTFDSIHILRCADCLCVSRYQTFLTLGLPVIAMVVTFVLYAYSNGSLEADVVFMSAGLFELLNMGMAIIPNALNELKRMLTSIDRIGRFLSATATYQAATNHKVPGLVDVDKADFSWDYHSLMQEIHRQAEADRERRRKQRQLKSRIKRSLSKASGIEMMSRKASSKANAGDKPAPSSVPRDVSDMSDLKPVLANIDMHIKPGQFVCIVGRVGSGKTSLISGMLGLVHQTTGSVSVQGHAAYVPQQAFVMNDTMRNNVLFGDDLDEDRYDAAVRSCELMQDLDMLPAGDESEVGEKGITISGGQKQRLAIARAAYAKPSIVLLDDPLSAMDAHVGRRVFDNCLLAGPLSTATRIMVTNQLQYCESSDWIYVMKNGEIVEEGTHADLMDRDAEYVQLAKHVVGTKHHKKKKHAEGAAVDDEGTPPGDDEDEGISSGVSDVSSDEQDDVVMDLDHRQPKAAAAAEAPRKKPLTLAELNERKKTGSMMSVEKKSQGRIGFPVFLALCRASSGRFVGGLVIATFFLCPLLQYSVNYTLALWSDDKADLSSNYLYYYLALAVCFAISAGTRSISTTVFFLRASRNLHKGMLDAVVRSPMAFFDTTPVGRILNRFGGDVMQMDLLLPRIFEIWSFVVGMTVVVIMVAGVVLPHILPAAVGLLAMTIYMYIKVGRVVLDLRRLVMMSYSPLMAFFSGYISGLDSIRAFGKVELFFSRFRDLQMSPITALFNMNGLQMVVTSSVLGIAVGLFMGVLALMFILLRDTSYVTPGTAGLVLSYCTVLSIRVPIVFFLSSMLEQLMSAAQRVLEYVSLPPEGNIKNRDTGAIVVPEDPEPEWPSEGQITLTNVVMSYRPGLPPVLRGVDVHIKAGEKIGVVGRTGAGKSSLVLALFRMVELSGGSITIDGVDVSTLDLGKFRFKLGMIPQDPFMFSGTIRSNLDIHGLYSDEQMWTTLRMVNLEKTVRELGEGLDAVVREKGDNFSAGTIQLFCIARVLLKKPKIIFMDEATASVDLETDALVQETIRSTFSNCTIITIAHRLNTVIDYDKVLVMSDGKVAQFGTPHELLNDSAGVFAELVRNTGESSETELKGRALAQHDEIAGGAAQ